jgi:hypothetical protein
MNWQPPGANPPEDGRPSSKGGWQLTGTVLAVIAAVGGLMIVAGVVLLFVTLSSGKFMSNK